MIMPREKKEIQKEDIMPLDVYIKNRKELRKNIVNFKKDRRISLGPYATFYFECYETMLAQVQEMLYIEKGGDEQLKDELTAYNPLIPNGKELTATLMFQIDNQVSRSALLRSAPSSTAPFKWNPLRFAGSPSRPAVLSQVLWFKMTVFNSEVVSVFSLEV